MVSALWNPLHGKGKRLLLLLVLLLAGWLLILTRQIIAAGEIGPVPDRDTAIILGAAVQQGRPTPVFEARIAHAIVLYRQGKVRRLIFTGGYGEGASHAESIVGRDYAVAHGVRPEDCLTEMASHTTRQNLLEARRLMISARLRTVLIVSDPLHMKRALRMSHDLGIDATGAPTPSSRYRSWSTKTGFLLRELYFYNHYLVTGQ